MYERLTRSVVVSFLSRYLQNLTVTSDIPLRAYKHLKPFVIVTRYLSQPHTTAQIPRHTGLLPGQFHRPIGTIDWPVAARVTKPTTTAVPLGVRHTA
jgi:hypothetical protein